MVIRLLMMSLLLATSVDSVPPLPTQLINALQRKLQFISHMQTFSSTGWPKNWHTNFVRLNFTKYQPIFRIIILSESGEKF